MKKLILDYSKWRCGENSDHSLGKGMTALLNTEGYMCCLGQFSLQLNSDIKPTDILNEGDPADLKYSIPLLNKESDIDVYRVTSLSGDAIDINDAKDTTIDEKISLLTSLFIKYECEIEVINKPENENNEKE